VLTELVTVTTADGVDLDGALYAAPGGTRPWARLLVVHGLTWNFYRGPSRWLPPLLAEAGCECLAINMRDHDLPEPKDFELSHHDLRAGIDFLWPRPGGPVVALGHGYGCNKLVCYPALSGDRRVRHYVLTTLGGVKTYRPDLWAQVLRLAPGLDGDVLIVQGAADRNIQARERADELLAAAAQARIEVSMLEGADHYFDGCHTQLAQVVARWLKTTVEGEGPGRRLTP
jgi:alpha-beta hydrolase superfamily lysophospholipase